MTFAVAARTRKVSRRLCTCPTTGNILILHKPLLGPTIKLKACVLELNVFQLNVFQSFLLFEG